MDDVAIRYLHFLAIMVMSSCLAAEHLLLTREISARRLRRLLLLDSLYGLSALTALGAGLALWLWVGKPASFYTSNPVFHLKLAVFVAIGLLSIYPTLFFIRQRKSGEGVIVVPGSIFWLVRTELVLLALMPLLAVVMARGYGTVL